MGASSSSASDGSDDLDDIQFETSEEYCRWTLSSVINAFQRYTSIKERHVTQDVTWVQNPQDHALSTVVSEDLNLALLDQVGV